MSTAPFGPGQRQTQFRKIGSGGFGDALNSYSHTMAWFQDSLYVGTTRANLCLLKNRLGLNTKIWPVPCPDDVYKLDLRSQIWRYTPASRQWKMVHRAPMIVGRTGEKAPREIGYRAMAVFQPPGEKSPALYVVTWAPSKALGPLVLRCADGEDFVPVTGYGFGDPGASTFRTLQPFNGRLFTSPTGKPGGKPNTPDLPIILECSDPARSGWKAANKPGFGDANNLTVFEMASFNGYLYAGTLNAAKGFQLWKTRATGLAPYHWEIVIADGAARGPLNEGVLSMCVFRNALYVGSFIQNGGHDLTYGIGPAAPELIRIHPNDEWELLVGEPRWTPQGYRYPLSGFGPGFDNPFAGYFWRLAEFQGELYLGTCDWSVLLPYLDYSSADLITRQRIERVGVDNLVKSNGGFDLFRSRDGVSWDPVTTNGFGNPFNFGARTMVATPYGLFLGTANPFGPAVAVDTPAGWTYAWNPNGGTEVWLGTPSV